MFSFPIRSEYLNVMRAHKARVRVLHTLAWAVAVLAACASVVFLSQ